MHDPVSTIGRIQIGDVIARSWIDRFPDVSCHAAWGATDIRAGGFDWDEDFGEPLRAAATAVDAAGFEPVLVITLDQYLTSPGQSTTECDPYPTLEEQLDSEFAPRVRAIAADYQPNLIVVDLNAAYDALPESTKCPGAWNVGYYREHVHQMDAGYAFMAEVMIDAIRGGPTPVVPSASAVPSVLILGLSTFVCGRMLQGRSRLNGTNELDFRVVSEL